MAQVIDVEDNNCSLRGFERNRYFFGKPMMVRDFAAEQQYFNGKRYLLNRLIHGGGIVCGLTLAANETGGFTLKAGAAIDCCGREIVVGSDYNKTDLTALEGYSDEIVIQRQTIYLCLMYDECIREPVHTQANTSSCSDVCDYNRIREGFKIIIKTTPPTAAQGLCELASSRKIVLEDNHLRLERIAPLWVNPKDVFEVQLIATPKNVTGTLVVEVQETFSPAGELTVVQGIPQGIPPHISFSLTQGGSPQKSSYLLRAGDAAIPEAEIKANIFFPPTETKVEDQSSAIEISAQKISELIVEKIFGDEQLGTCPSCKDDHCLYLASAKLGEDGKLTEVKLFPANQYVYNNPLLFELLACGENRIGKIPEIPVSNETTQVVPAVTAFKFSQGLTAADGGLGQADVTAKVDNGLKIEHDTIVADLGNGLVLDGTQIAARTGRGVKLSGNLIAADLGDGLKLDANDHITANLGSGLEIDIANHEIVAVVGNGVKFVGNQIQPDYSTQNLSGKVCEANDPRLSNARPPLAHAVTHQSGGTDSINVQNLLGVLHDAQKVEVQDEGTTIAARPRLNFVGAGVTVTDEAAQNRVDINIRQSGRVSTGLVTFLAMRPGEVRESQPIDHLQGTNPCAIVLALAVSIPGAGFEEDFFGNLQPFVGLTPAIAALNATLNNGFLVFLKDTRVDKQGTQDYTVRWWAIPKDLDAPPVSVAPPQPPDPALPVNPVTDNTIRLAATLKPGASTEELAASLGVEANAIKTQIDSLKSAGKINIVDGKVFPQ